MSTLGSLVKQAREKKRWTQAELVSAIKKTNPELKISQHLISEIEREQQPYVDDNLRAALAKALDSFDILWVYFENPILWDAASEMLGFAPLSTDQAVIQLVTKRIQLHLDKINSISADLPKTSSREYYVSMLQLRECADRIRSAAQAFWLFFGGRG